MHPFVRGNGTAFLLRFAANVCLWPVVVGNRTVKPVDNFVMLPFYSRITRFVRPSRTDCSYLENELKLETVWTFTWAEITRANFQFKHMKG